MPGKLVACFTSQAQEYQVLQGRDAEAAARRHGLPLEVLFAEDNVVLQIQQLFRFIHAPAGERPLALLVHTRAPDGLERVARNATQAGIGWVLLNRPAAYLEDLRGRYPMLPILSVSTDHHEVGRIQARQFCRLLPRGGSVLYLQGPPAMLSAQRRLEGLRSELGSTPFEIKLVNAEWTERSAEAAVAAWLRLKSSELFEPDLVGSQNDVMARGARKVLAAQRPEWGGVPFVGCDGLPTGGQRLVDEGQLAATVVVPSCGGPGVDVVVESVRTGEPPPPQVVLPPSSYPELDRLKSVTVTALILGALLGVASATAETSNVVVRSPDRRLVLRVGVGEGGRLQHQTTVDGRSVVEPSPLGVAVDGIDLGQGVSLGKVETYRRNERYPWRGVHAVARNHFNGARVALTHAASRTAFTLDLRAFDDAVAFRILVPGSGSRVPDAATAFRLPPGTTVWYHGPRDHYEGLYTRKELTDVPAEDWAAPPLTYRLAEGGGYASITEAALRDYAGMMLQADGQGGFRERLGHSVPASYPYTLRYGEENARRLAAPAATVGPITTPWRVVLVGRDLDALVNSDAVHNLCPPPDPGLFPQGIRTPWLRPGRAVWRYLDGGESTFEGIKEFSRLAGELGFEHHVVEGQWRRWTDEQVRDLVDYSKERGVSVWVWIHSRDQRDPEERRRLFARLCGLGVAGIKVDFLDHEAREVIDHYQAILKDAAENRLLVNFHGANKPTGEARTWPNEMTREAVRGMEYRSTPAFAEHNTTLPFTRFLAGPADYTPVVFGERRKDTTGAHQVATAVVFTSPVLIYGGHPRSLLENPAAELIRAVPSVWDETRVLPASAIGEAAVFARRRGRDWFLGVLGGPQDRTLQVPLSFLGRGRYRAVIARDRTGEAAAIEIERREVGAGDALEIPLRAGGGLVAMFTR